MKQLTGKQTPLRQENIAVDTKSAIGQVLPKLYEMISDGLVTLEKIEVIRYHPKKPS